MEKSKKYVMNILILTLLLCGSIIAINILMDPYNIFHSNKIVGVNKYDVNSGKQQRLYRILKVAEKTNTEVLFLGASSTQQALSPKYYQEITGKNTYNAAFDAARMYEIRRMLEQAVLYDSGLSEVVIGLNFYMFGEEWDGKEDVFYDDQIEREHLTALNFFRVALSRRAVEDSMYTLYVNYTKQYKYSIVNEDGSYNIQDLEYIRLNQTDVKKFAVDAKISGRRFRKWKFSLKAFDELKKIVALCEEKHITLKLYINPAHAIFLETIKQSAGWDKFEEWKKQLVEIYPVYDFATFNVITEEPYSHERKYYRNTEHCMPVVGKLILDRVGETQRPVVDGFGVLLNRDNIDEVLKEQRKNQIRWEFENTECIQMIYGLLNEKSI